MRYNIVLVGAGQLGSRYLQGLAKFSEPLSIFVIDVNRKSLEIARFRWLEGINDSKLHVLNFKEDMLNLPKKIDLAIISTSSSVREKVISNLILETSVNYWLLEKVLAQNTNSLFGIEKLVGRKAWVNTPFRTLEWFKEIKKNSSKGVMHLKVNGSNWGIGCNTIHFLDFISWWTDESISHFDNSKLDEKWHPAKREGFWEINGCLVVYFSNGSTGTFYSDNENNSPFELRIQTISENWIIGWDTGVAKRDDGLEINGRVLFQSEMTPDLVKEILETGQCELPTLETSIKQHKPFLESLLEHWNISNSINSTLLPIT